MTIEAQLQTARDRRALAVAKLCTLLDGLPTFKRVAMESTSEGRIITAAREAIEALGNEQERIGQWIKEGAF